MAPEAIVTEGEHSTYFLFPTASFLPLQIMAEDLASFCQHYLLVGKRAMVGKTHFALPGVITLINVYRFQHFSPYELQRKYISLYLLLLAESKGNKTKASGEKNCSVV